MSSLQICPPLQQQRNENTFLQEIKRWQEWQTRSWNNHLVFDLKVEHESLDTAKTALQIAQGETGEENSE